MDAAVRLYMARRLNAARDVCDTPSAFLGPQQRAEVITSTLAHFGGALEAFRAMGSIDDEEFSEWHERMLVALGIEPPDPPPRDLPEGTFAVVQAVQIPGTKPSAPPERRSLGQLVRVLPGPNGQVDLARGSFRVRSIEIYEDGLQVLWRFFPIPDPEAAFPGEMEKRASEVEGLTRRGLVEVGLDFERRLVRSLTDDLALSDDVATVYNGWGASSGGNSEESTGGNRFFPAPPVEARLLRVTWRGVTLEVVL